MHLHCPRFAWGCLAASEAASRPPIGIKWYYEGSTSDLGDLRGLRPSVPQSVGFPIVQCVPKFLSKQMCIFSRLYVDESQNPLGFW